MSVILRSRATGRRSGARASGGSFNRRPLAHFRSSRAATVDDISYFNAAAFDLSHAEFETDGEDTLVKRALIMVEGSHTDSKKRHHVFDAQRIKRIFHNTVSFLTKGGRVPWQQDHQKTQNANIGDLECYDRGDLELKVIEQEDLPHPRLKNLIGKIGIFANRLVAKGQDVIDQIQAGRIKTLSPGIDVEEDIIREISATPTPAIVGLSTFHRYANNDSATARFALTFEEAEAELADLDAVKQQFLDMGETFWVVVQSIQDATEEELQGNSPDDYLTQAISDYSSRIWDLLNPTPAFDPNADPNAPQQQPGMPPTQGQQMGFQFSAFTLDGVEDEFAAFSRRNRRRQRRW